MYLLDISAVGELREPRLHGGDIAWVLATEAAQLHLSVVTRSEIRIGV